jgi:hypothetical protein
MARKKSIYRIHIKHAGTPLFHTYRWEIYKNLDVLPTVRSSHSFVSRVAGLADANASRSQLIIADLQMDACSSAEVTQHILR